MVKRARVFGRLLLLGFLAGGGACKPNLNDAVSIVDSDRLLALRVGPAGGPAEAVPMGVEPFAALYVSPAGAVSPPNVDWAICTEREPLAELDPVSPLCLYASGPWFVPLGVGNPVSGALPNDACSNFGPEVPTPMPGHPPGRPVDPDVTGGYYQPVRALAAAPQGNISAVAEARVTCDLANAPANAATAYKQRYHRNTNPVVQSLGVKGGAPWSAAGAAGAGINSVPRGQHLELEVAWPGASMGCPLTDVAGDGFCGPDEVGAACAACAAGVAVVAADCCPGGDCNAPLGCTGAERYVVFDSQSASLVDAREGIAVSWFATAGAFDSDATGRAGTDTATSSDNGWQSPAVPGPVTVWVVLRDDRGGVGWETYALNVE